jgi:hypothetical protein
MDAMTDPLFSDKSALPPRSPSSRDLARLAALLSADIGQAKRVRLIAQLAERLRTAPVDQRSRIIVSLCAFIRTRAPVTAARPKASTPPQDVQAALNVLAARPETQSSDGAEWPIDLRDSDLTGAWLASGLFRRARFDRSLLRMVDLSYASLEEASFRDADLGGATLAHSRLAGADFSGTRFDETDVTGAGITGTGVASRGEAPRWRHSDRAA